MAHMSVIYTGGQRMAKKMVDISKLDNNQKIRALFKIFKKYLPLHKPVKLIIRDLAYDDGMCGWAGDGRKGFVISINKSLCYNCKIDTLIHEYAHAITMAQNTYDPKEDHDKSWGEQFAVTYRCFLEHWPEYNDDKEPRLIERL
tara:strand:+ start:874 stop:1305 length:432 start_codon:yes stop_codon:yes gene_type:complete